jgi:hypothetical protein
MRSLLSPDDRESVRRRNGAVVAKEINDALLLVGGVVYEHELALQTERIGGMERRAEATLREFPRVAGWDNETEHIASEPRSGA